MENSVQPLLGELPSELLLVVFSKLAPEDLLKVSQVCRQWRDLAKDRSLWPIDVTYRRGQTGITLPLGGTHIGCLILNGIDDVEPILRRVARFCPNLIELKFLRCDTSWFTQEEEAMGEGDVNDPWIGISNGCRSLRHLELRMMDLTDSMMHLIENAADLRFLKLIACNFVTHERIVAAVKNKPHLETLDLSPACWSDTALYSILSQCRHSLKALYGIEDVSDCSFSDIGDTQLEAISLSDSGLLSLDTIRSLAPKLQVFRASYDDGDTAAFDYDDAFLTKLQSLFADTHFPRLIHLAVCGPSLTDPIVSSLTAGLQTLTTLVLESTTMRRCEVSDSSFYLLRENCPNLNVLAIVRSMEVDGSGLLSLLHQGYFWPSMKAMYFALPRMQPETLKLLCDQLPTIKVVNRVENGTGFSHPDPSVDQEIWELCFLNPDLGFEKVHNL